MDGNKMADITQEILNLKEQSIAESYKVTAKLINIHGDWAKGAYNAEGVVWDEKVVETQTESMARGEEATSLDTEKNKVAKKTRVVVQELHKFPRNAQGQILIPLGGPRGYICGMFRAAARTNHWSKQGSKYYGCLSFLDNGGVIVENDWVPVNIRAGDVKIRPFFIKEAKTTVPYEYIEECIVEFTVSIKTNLFPNDMTRKLIADLTTLKMGPKRRGYLKFVSVEKLSA